MTLFTKEKTVLNMMIDNIYLIWTIDNLKK